MTWRERLNSALKSEYGDRGAVAVLATVSPAGQPAGRCVILRRITDDGRLCFTSDLRSDKIDHLRHQPAAETILWLPTLRLQYRIAGDVRILTGEAAAGEWTDLIDATRVTFFGPPPGDRFRVAAPVDADLSKPPPTFAVLELIAYRVESLDLNSAPHVRLCWSRDERWREQRINP